MKSYLFFVFVICKKQLHFAWTAGYFFPGKSDRMKMLKGLETNETTVF